MSKDFSRTISWNALVIRSFETVVSRNSRGGKLWTLNQEIWASILESPYHYGQIIFVQKILYI